MATGGQQTGCIETDAEMAPEVPHSQQNGHGSIRTQGPHSQVDLSQPPQKPGCKTDASPYYGDRSYQVVGDDKPSQICTSSTTQKLPMYDGRSHTGERLQPDEITEDDIPAELKEGQQFDILMLYAEEDRENAWKLKEIFERFVHADGKPLQICTADSELQWISSTFERMDAAIARSTYMFLFVTEAFCNDQWAIMQKDDILMTSITDPNKRWCVVPLFIDGRRNSDYTLPFGIKGLKGIDVNLLLGKRHIGDVNVKELTEHDLDRFVVMNVKKMIQSRMSLKLARRKDDRRKLSEWKDKEFRRRYDELLEEERQKREREMLLRRPTTRPGSPRADEKIRPPDDPPRSPRSKEDHGRSSIVLNIHNLQNLQIGNNNQIRVLHDGDAEEDGDEDLSVMVGLPSSHRPPTPVDVTSNSPRDPTLPPTSQVTADGGSGDTTPVIEDTSLKKHYPVGSSGDCTRSSRDRAGSLQDRAGSLQRSLPDGETTIDATVSQFGIAVRHSVTDDDDVDLMKPVGDSVTDDDVDLMKPVGDSVTDDDVDLMKPVGRGQTSRPGTDASLDEDTDLLKPAACQLAGRDKDWLAKNSDGTRVGQAV